MTEASPYEGAVSFQGAVTWSLIASPRRWSKIGMAVWVLGDLLGGIAMGLEVWPAMALTGLVTFASYPLFIASYVRSLTEATSPGSISVQNGWLRIMTASGLREVAVADVAAALVLERPPGMSPVLELRLRSGDVARLQSPDPTAAARLASALGFGPGGRSLEVDLAKPIRRLLHVVLGLGVQMPLAIASTVLAALAGGEGAGLGVAKAVAALLFLPLYLLARHATAAPVVRVGEDGVLVRRGFRRRFIPRAEIATAERHGRTGLALRRADGQTYLESEVTGGDADRVEAVARYVMATVRTGSATRARLAAFDKGTDPVAAWRVRVGSALEAGGYRDATSPVEEAHAVLRGGDASAEQRVGAALALRAAGEPPARIRVAAEAVADDELRRALEAVAADDDAGLEKAVARLSH